MSNAKRSSVSKGRETKTNKNRFERNYVKARNSWPDPFASSKHKQGQQANNQKTTVRSSDNSRQSRSKSDNQNKTRN